MPLCKNSSGYYTGNEPSPKGLGYCARSEEVGKRRRGNDGDMWIVQQDKNGRLSWKKLGAGAKNPGTPKRTKARATPGTPRCRRDQIVNPRTNRCVLKKGKIGQELLRGVNVVPTHSPMISTKRREVDVDVVSHRYDAITRTLFMKVFIRHDDYRDREEVPIELQHVVNAQAIRDYTRDLPGFLRPLLDDEYTNYGDWRLVSVTESDDKHILLRIQGTETSMFPRQPVFLLQSISLIGHFVDRPWYLDFPLVRKVVPRPFSNKEKVLIPIGIGELETELIGTDLDVTKGFLDILRAGPQSFEKTNTSGFINNAYVFGPKFPIYTYRYEGDHYNDVGGTGIVRMDGYEYDIDLWNKYWKKQDEMYPWINGNRNVTEKQMTKLARSIVSDKVVFIGETKSGDVGANVYTHRNSQGEIDSLIIDSWYFFPEGNH